MAKQIARLLKADIQDSSDLKSIAKMLSKKGRGGDTMLAHITPKEARILKEAGGAGTVNPDTGLMEFFDLGDYAYGADYGNQQASLNEYIPPQQSAESPYTFSDGQATAPMDLTPQMAVQQYEGSAYPYTPGGNYQYVGQDVDGKFIREFPGGMSSLYDLSAAQNAAAAGVPPASGAVSTAPAVTAPEARTVTAPGAETPVGKSIGDYWKDLQKATGLSAADLLRVGGAGAGAIAGRAQAQKAAQQVQQAVQEQKQVGQPYQKAGQELQRAALAGELTPQSAQALQALRAQMAQGIEARGGVGVAQAQAQMEAFRQNLLQNQYNFGLQVSQIGDQMALGAIRTGMQLDQQLAAANQQFYTQLAAIAGGGTYGYKAPGAA